MFTGCSFQHISGHIRMVPACNWRYDNLFIMLSQWNIIPQTQLYDILPGHIILVPILCRVFDKGASTTSLKSLVRLCQELKLGPHRHGENAPTRDFRCWSRLFEESVLYLNNNEELYVLISVFIRSDVHTFSN